MGGFVDDEEVLSLDRIEELVRNREIEYPIVSRREIQDRSKGDAVTKALVVSQTAWFLLQCAARASQHLALTELELATAAFAVLNIIMYVLWCDKPSDVECSIRVRRRRRGINETSEEQIQAPEESEFADRCTGKEWNWQSCFRGWSWDDVWNMIKPFYAMMGGADDETFLVVGWSQNSNNLNILAYLSNLMLVTTLFGGIHCIGWSFAFPSRTEQLLWRISSISITAIPLGVVVIGTILNRFEVLSAIVAFLVPLLYIVSRVVLLVMSLTTLRSLPSSAFQTVEWTTFIPHV